MHDFLYSFQSQFPSFIFGLTSPDATAESRVSSYLMILSIAIAITALTLFNKKITLSYILLLIFSTVAYSMFTFVEGIGTGELTMMFIGYIVSLSVLYLISSLIERHTRVKSL